MKNSAKVILILLVLSLMLSACGREPEPIGTSEPVLDAATQSTQPTVQTTVPTEPKLKYDPEHPFAEDPENRITREQAQQITEGMLWEDVVELLGRPTASVGLGRAIMEYGFTENDGALNLIIEGAREPGWYIDRVTIYDAPEEPAE